MKKQKMYAMGFVLTGLLLFTTNVFSQDQDFYIFLCFGQSNMEGQGAIEAQDMTVDSSFQVMEAIDCSNLGRTKGNWYDAVPPLCRCYNGLSPADYFGRTMVANLPPEIRIGVVNVSVAGCAIELYDKDDYETYVATAPDWMINIINEYDGNPYGYLVEIARLAQLDGVIKGILLHQGESNTGDSEWPAKVKGVYDSLITDLGLNPDSVPLLAGEVVDAEQGGVCASVNSIIATLPLTLPNSYVISSRGCTDAGDNLHFSPAGYRKIGSRYAVKMLSLLGYESIYLEAECGTIGESWEVLADADASNGGYVTVKPGIQSISEPPTGDTVTIQWTFTLSNDTTYNIYGRVNCPTTDDDSYWLKIDEGEFVKCEGLTTTGWQWVQLYNAEMDSGEHNLTIAYSEDGALLDKICIKNSFITPTNTGEEAGNICAPEFPPDGINLIEMADGYDLVQNFPNPFNGKTSIAFEIPENTYVSLKVFNMLGIEIVELAGKEFEPGKHTLNYESWKLSEGTYFYIIKTDKFSATRKMQIQSE